MLICLGGAPCLLCESQVEDWTDLHKVTEGLPITRRAEETEALYNTLRDENGEIARKPKDFLSRKGLTTKPLTISDQHSITILHAYINDTTFFIKLLARIECPHFTWEVRSDHCGEPVRAAKTCVLNKIQSKTGLVLEQVQSGSGHTGTSTTGNSGCRFFSQEMKAVLEEIIPDG